MRYEEEQVTYHNSYFVPISLAGIIKNQGGISKARVNPTSWITNFNSHILFSNSRAYFIWGHLIFLSKLYDRPLVIIGE